MPRLIHTADYHLSASRNRIDPETGLNQRLTDKFKCARFVAEDGVRRGAEIMLIAGDIFDSPRPTPSERRYAIQSLEPAISAGIPILACTGNHECPRTLSEKHALDTLRDIPGLTIVDRPCLLGFALGDNQPAPSHLADLAAWEDPAGLSLQIAVMPWPNASLLPADAENRRLDPGERNLLIRQAVMDILRGLAAELRPGIPSVLLAHVSLDMAAAGAGDRLMLLGGDWTLSAAAVAALGFDYVALGHLHKPQQIAGTMSYSGSPEACNHGEEGEAKSFLLVDIPPDDPEGITVEAIATPYRRFHTVDVAEGVGWGEWPEMQGAIVRLRVPQAMAAEATQLRATAEDLGALEVTIEIIRAEAQHRAGAIEISYATELDPAIRTWAAQRPDLEPLTDDLVAEGLAIDRSLQGGAA